MSILGPGGLPHNLSAPRMFRENHTFMDAAGGYGPQRQQSFPCAQRPTKQTLKAAPGISVTPGISIIPRPKRAPFPHRGDNHPGRHRQFLAPHGNGKHAPVARLGSNKSLHDTLFFEKRL